LDVSDDCAVAPLCRASIDHVVIRRLMPFDEATAHWATFEMIELIGKKNDKHLRARVA
jgi:hypothetical protein